VTQPPIKYNTSDFTPFPNVKIASSFDEWVRVNDPYNKQSSHWQSEKYQQSYKLHLNDITPVLTRIVGSILGRALLSEFSVHVKNSLYILPWELVPPGHQKTKTGQLIGAHTKGVNGNEDPNLRNGVGAGSLIFFSTARAGSGSATADENLVHELVHASRMSRGILDLRKMQRDADDVDEFLSNLVENIYRMALRNGQFLRYDRNGLYDVNTYMDSNGNHPSPRDALASFRQRQRSIYDALMHCHIRYNPIAQYEGEIRAKNDYPKAHFPD
jgi:hypothetical protein